MSNPSKSKYAILGFLAMRPMTGYEIKKYIEESINFFWKESYGQIYPTLKKFDEQGLARIEVDSNSKARTRKIYSITPRGLAQLETWLKQETDSFVPRIELLLKIYFGDFCKHKVLIQHLNREREKELELIKIYKQVKKQLENSDVCDRPTYALITLDYGLGLSKFNVDWSERTIKKLKLEGNKK